MVIGVVAAALDLSSGAALAGDSHANTDPLVYAVLLVVIGGAALLTGVAAVIPKMGERTKQVGLAMEVCGVAMAAISALAPIMGPLTDFAMLAVGGLMVLSGALMQRKTQMAPRV